MISGLVFAELAELFEYWLARNQCDDEVVRIVTYRRIHRELLAFFVCLTERFARRHEVPEASRFVDSLADGVREDALGHAGYPPSMTRSSELHRATFICRRMQRVRALHAFQSGERVVDQGLLNAAAWAIALQLSVSPIRELNKDQSQVVSKRLGQLADLLLRMPPYLELAVYSARSQ
jgi:hypothetical protein